MQPFHLVERHISAGRIVGIGQEHDLGALGHGREDRIDVGGVVLLGRCDRLRAGAERGDGIDEKPVGGVDRLVTVAEIGVGDQVQQIVRAGAADDAAGIEPEGAPDRFAQRGGGAVGIVLEMLGNRAIGGDCFRAGAERRLVRRQLEHAGNAGCRALARDIGIDREHAGTRLRTLQSGHFTNLACAYAPCRQGIQSPPKVSSVHNASSPALGCL